MKRIAVCMGTRPDIIKMFGPYTGLKNRIGIETILIHSYQHGDLSESFITDFDMIPNLVLPLMPEDRYFLPHFNSKLIDNFGWAFRNIKPDLVLVHGDKLTAISAALSAFQMNIPVAHIEAGLRTSSYEYPFPEEGYRRAISKITKLHFAPTQKSAMNLRSEGINDYVYVTGNTIVDTLKFFEKKIGHYVTQGRSILVTCHRRESYGDPLINLVGVLCGVVSENPDLHIFWPVHPNPKVDGVVRDSWITNGSPSNLELISPLGYKDFIRHLKQASVVITDSGGVMEESAILGKPTIVMRTETERPEVLDLPSVRLVGYEFDQMKALIDLWLAKPPINTPSTVFGDGTAGEEISDLIMEYLSE